MYSAVHYRIRRLKQHTGHPYGVAYVLFFMAFVVRSFRLEQNPLWLDEIYGYQLGRLGISGILRNSLVDPHPPLYYFIQWIVSGFGAFHTEWAWRWLPVLSGSLSVPFVYELARRSAGNSSALLASLLLVVSPTHIYFSQESRPPNFVMFIAVASAMLVLQIQRYPDRRWLWVGYAACCVIGLWCSYSFVLVIGAEILYLAVVLRQWYSLLILTGAVALCALPLVGMLITTLGAMLGRHAASEPLQAIHVTRALLAGEPLRYCYSGSTPGYPACLLPWRS